MAYPSYGIQGQIMSREQEIFQYYENMYSKKSGEFQKEIEYLRKQLLENSRGQIGGFYPSSQASSSPPKKGGAELLKQAKEKIDELTSILESVKKEPLILQQIDKISKDKKYCFIKKGDIELRIDACKNLERGDEVLLHPKTMQIIEHLGRPPLEISPYAAPEIPNVKWEDIGGLENAKDNLIEAIEMPHKHKDLFKWYNKRHIKGILLAGPPGCIDGEALIQVNIGGKGHKIKLKEFVERFNAKSLTSPKNNGKSKYKRKYIWGKDIDVMVRCLHNGEFRLKKLTAAYAKGIKKVVKTTLEDGKELILTPDHEVFTKSGKWKAIGNLKIGDEITTNGNLQRGVWQDEDGYRYICRGIRKHPRFDKKRSKGEICDMPEHRLVMEASINGLSLEEWLEVIKTGKFAKDHKFLTSKQLVHHKDEDPSNNSPENLMIVNHYEHAIEHKIHKNFPLFKPKYSKIKSIVDNGTTEVFDLTIEEAHNFIANGIVVHNCGKTMLGKAAANSLAKAYGAESSKTGFLYIKGPEILNQYVGATEQTIRDLFFDAKRHKEEHGYPAIIFIDEADALLASRTNGGMGLGATIVPMFLTEMDGMQESTAIVILATNRPDILDPAIVRDGRIDRKITVNRPNITNGTKILKMHLAKVPLAEGLELDKLAAEMGEEFYSKERLVRKDVVLNSVVNGAMLANCVDMAVSYALKRDALDKTKEGLKLEDCIAAIDRIQEQSGGVLHDLEMTISFRQTGGG